MRQARGYDVFILVASSATTFFLFQFAFIFSVTQLNGRCLFSIWAPTLSMDLSLFGVFALIVALHALWFAAWAVSALVTGSEGRGITLAIVIVAFVALGMWGRTMWRMWDYFQYEVGAIEAPQWLQRPSPRWWSWEPQRCDVQF